MFDKSTGLLCLAFEDVDSEVDGVVDRREILPLVEVCGKHNHQHVRTAARDLVSASEAYTAT